jgi:hypothetical protein
MANTKLLEHQKAVYVKNLVSDDLLKFFTNALIRQSVVYPRSGDTQVPNALSIMDHEILFETLLERIWPTMEQIIGEELIPTYAYARLYSNGSLGDGSVFKLPFSHFWLFGVERFLKSGGVGFSIGLHLVAGSEISFTRSDFNSWCGGWLRVGYGVDPFLLRRRLLGLFGLFGGLNLLGRSFVFLFLFGNVGFRGVLSGLFLDKVLLSVVNTDDVPFFDSCGVLVNDQMMDWGSGVGFWGCRFGVRHFLPLFCLGGLGVPLGVGGNLLGFGGGGLVDDFLVCDDNLYIN